MYIVYSQIIFIASSYTGTVHICHICLIQANMISTYRDIIFVHEKITILQCYTTHRQQNQYFIKTEPYLKCISIAALVCQRDTVSYTYQSHDYNIYVYTYVQLVGLTLSRKKACHILLHPQSQIVLHSFHSTTVSDTQFRHRLQRHKINKLINVNNDMLLWLLKYYKCTVRSRNKML